MEAPTLKNCHQVAYHETGHIVLAYLNGYSCESVQLNRKMETGMDTWMARTFLNFGADSCYISRFTGIDADVQFFETLDIAGRHNSIQVAHRLSQVLLGGSVAEQLYQSGFSSDPGPAIEKIDLMKVEFINHILEIIDDNHQPGEFIPGLIRSIFQVFQSTSVLKSISNLTNLLCSVKKLDTALIESCLEFHPLLLKRDGKRA